MVITGLLEQLELLVTQDQEEKQDLLVLLVSRVSLAQLAVLVRLEDLATGVSLERWDLMALLGQRESVVTLGLLEQLALRAPLDLVAPLEPLELMEDQVSPVLPDSLVMLDPTDPPECPVSVVQPAPLDLKARRERLDTEDQRVTLAEMAVVVLLDPAGPLDLLVLMVKRVRVVLLA